MPAATFAENWEKLAGDEREASATFAAAGGALDAAAFTRARDAVVVAGMKMGLVEGEVPGFDARITVHAAATFKVTMRELHTGYTRPEAGWGRGAAGPKRRAETHAVRDRTLATSATQCARCARFARCARARAGWAPDSRASRRERERESPAVLLTRRRRCGGGSAPPARMRGRRRRGGGRPPHPAHTHPRLKSALSTLETPPHATARADRATARRASARRLRLRPARPPTALAPISRLACCCGSRRGRSRAYTASPRARATVTSRRRSRTSSRRSSRESGGPRRRVAGGEADATAPHGDEDAPRCRTVPRLRPCAPVKRTTRPRDPPRGRRARQQES